MTRYGYARVSTEEQTHDPQLVVLEREGVREIVLDTVSGGVPAASQPGLSELLAKLQPGDSLVAARLDLLSSSHAAGQFVVELHKLALEADLGRKVRSAAYSLLLEGAKSDPRPDMPALLSENSRVSLELGAIAVRSFGSEKFEPSHVIDLLRKLSELYPKQNDARNQDWSSLYSIEMMIKSLDQQITVQALNQLTISLACSYRSRHEVQCICRPGISKIIGLLLDYHLPTKNHHDAAQVWQWTRALVFHNHRVNDDNPSSRFLDANSGLRQAIHRVAVYGLTGEQAEKPLAASLTQIYIPESDFARAI